MTPEVLYEDNHLLVVNKPAGMLTQPTNHEQESLELICKEWLKAKYKKPGNVFLHALHRLDKPVSGIVVFARTSKALSRLQASMRDFNIKKTYYALVEKAPQPSQGTLEHYLVHDDHISSLSKKGDPKAKLARLHYRVKEKKESHFLLEIELETGRYHQIRAQLAAIGCPIVGDIKYGSKQTLPFKGIGLHHAFMQIPHPITGELLTFEANFHY